MKRLESKVFYDIESARDFESKEYKFYINRQRNWCGHKASSRREKKYYQEISQHVLEHLDTIGGKASMVCLGTRNNWERDQFQIFLKSAEREMGIYSLDVGENENTRKCDYIMDFNNMPEEWANKWDIIFSNSIDHTVSATETFREWLRVTKPGGLLVIGFDLWEGKTIEHYGHFYPPPKRKRYKKNMDKYRKKHSLNYSNPDLYPSQYDCTIFEKENIDSFFEENKECIVLDSFQVKTFYHKILRKKIDI